MAEAYVPHRVTIERISNQTEAYEFDNADEARRCIETAKQNREVWHIYHSEQRAPRGRRFIALSLYRSAETGEWRADRIA